MDENCARMLERVRALEEIVKSNQRRLDATEMQIKATNELAISVSKMATDMGYMKTTLTSIDGRLDVIESKPAKRWETVVGQIIGLLVATAVGYFLSKI